MASHRATDRRRSGWRGVARTIGPIVGLAVIAGCASTRTEPVSTAAPVMTSDGLAEVSRTRTSGLWVKPDHQLGRYDDVLINVAGFLYRDGQEPLSTEQEREIRRMLAGAILGITEGTPVGVANRSGECVVRVEIEPPQPAIDGLRQEGHEGRHEAADAVDTGDGVMSPVPRPLVALMVYLESVQR